MKDYEQQSQNTPIDRSFFPTKTSHSTSTSSQKERWGLPALDLFKAGEQYQPPTSTRIWAPHFWRLISAAFVCSLLLTAQQGTGEQRDAIVLCSFDTRIASDWHEPRKSGDDACVMLKELVTAAVSASWSVWRFPSEAEKLHSADVSCRDDVMQQTQSWTVISLTWAGL